MIREVSGDILQSQVQLIAHGVAPNDHFATGLALALRERWPTMVRDFRHYMHSDRPKAGTIWVWPTEDGRRVASLLTQEGEVAHGGTPGPAHIEHVRHALRELRRFIERENIQSVALPKLATGVGGLSWEAVYPIIQQELGDLKVPVIVYTTYRAGQQAHEQLPASASFLPANHGHSAVARQE